MADLPDIFNPQPVTIPAQDEKTYPNGWCREYHCFTNQDGTMSLRATIRPYNKATGELYPKSDRDYEIFIKDIFVEVARVAMFAQLMGLTLTCLGLGIQERHLIEQINGLDPDTQADQIAALQAELSQVETTMGASGPPA